MNDSKKESALSKLKLRINGHEHTIFRSKMFKDDADQSNWYRLQVSDNKTHHVQTIDIKASTLFDHFDGLTKVPEQFSDVVVEITKMSKDFGERFERAFRAFRK